MNALILHLEMEQREVAGGLVLLNAGFPELAARAAYMAVFHGAQAFIMLRTTKEPKTHKGTHAEFARLARDEVLITPDLRPLLSQFYSFKTVADYSGEHGPTAETCTTALQDARRFLTIVAGLVNTNTAA